MKVKKVLKVISAILAALILLLVLLVLFWLGPTVKFLAERIGSRALGTPVSIESLSINPGKGTIDLNAFTIETHEGFSRTNTWALAHLHIALDMGSLFSDTIIVHEVRIDSPHFTYEQNNASDNIAELIDNLQEFSGIDPDTPIEKPAKEKPAKEKKGSGKPPKKVIVEYLVINDVQMHIANTDDPKLDLQLTLEQLSLSYTNGAVQLKNISLSNPARLATPNLFDLESIDIQLDPASIYSDKMVIEDIQVVKPYAYLEQNPETDTVAEFMKIADSFSAKVKAPAEKDSAESPKLEDKPEDTATAAEPPPVELHNLFVDDIEIKLLDTTKTNAAPQLQTLAVISGISVRLVEGHLQITGITIPSPDGFTVTNLLHLEKIDISIDPASIFSPQVIIKEVAVASPQITVQQTATSGNAAELQKTLRGFIPPAPVATATPEPAAPDAADPVAVATNEEAPAIPLSKRPVILEMLSVTNLAMHVILPGATNTPAMRQISKLNPLGFFRDSETNAPADEVSGNEILTLLAFEQLTVEPLKGLIQLSDLQIGNPPDFANESLATVEHLRIDIDPASITTDTLLIEDVLISGPRIVYERKISRDNIKSLETFVKSAFAIREESLSEEGGIANTAVAVAAEDTTPDDVNAGNKTDSEEAGGQKVVIAHLLVKDGIVKAKLPGTPTIPLIPLKFEMTDVGKEDGGTNLSGALSTVYESFYDSIIGAVSGVTEFATDALKGVGALTFDALGTVTGGATDGIQERLGLDNPSAEDEPEKPKEEKKKRRPYKKWKRPGSTF